MPVTALMIILAILLAIFALLMLQAHITVEYREALCVRISVLGIPLWQHPRKKKKVRISDYTQKKIEKRKKREAKRLAKKKRKQAKKEQKNQTRATTAPASPKKGLLDNLSLVREILTAVLKKTAGHVRLRAQRIIIHVATDDAAKTAILFGAVNQAVIAIVELLDQMKKWRGLRASQIAVNADFASQKSTVDISISLSLRVWQMLNILLHAALRLVKEKAKPKLNTKSKKIKEKKQS